MTKVKICGLRSFDDALMAAQAGADMLGLNFYRKTPRGIEPKEARAIADSLRQTLGAQCPVLVGVFVNAAVDCVRQTADDVGLDFVQLHGDESCQMVGRLQGLAFKAVRPVSKADALTALQTFAPAFPEDERAPSLLVDAFNPKLYGGTGETASLNAARAVNQAVPRMMLAGGLNPENVADRVRAIRPWGVDTASGVEKDVPGFKDAGKVRAFIQAVRDASR